MRECSRQLQNSCPHVGLEDSHTLSPVGSTLKGPATLLSRSTLQILRYIVNIPDIGRKSTDYDVHRNWLAITHSLPVRKWYFEDTSQWTLDYPPLFAWFEYVLSHLAVFFDPDMLKVENVDYRSSASVVFQRLSVVATDLVYIYAVKELYSFCKKKVGETENILLSPALVQATILLTNAGLIIVDHIHFQYNGFLYGMLLLSIVRIYQGRNISAAFWFAALLNFKHIYLYIAPAYFVYLLRCYVFSSNEVSGGGFRWRTFSILRFLGLGGVVIVVFAISLGPFVILNQIPQVISRLFPFKRGLCHAYWAPNFWALYNLADKGLFLAGTGLGLFETENQTASMTGGLVQQFEHRALPCVSPLITLFLSGLAMLPAIHILWCRPKGAQGFVRALVLCGFGSFMFGWHVHEKAILMVIIPMSLLIIDKKKDAQLYLLLSTIGHYSLFPLLFTQFETPVKMCLLALTSLYAFTSLANIFRISSSFTSLPFLSSLESMYIIGIVPLELYNSVLHSALGLSTRFPFLPLMFTSVYCAIGITYCWIMCYWLTFREKTKHVKQN